MSEALQPPPRDWSWNGVKVKTGLAGQDAVQATKTFLDESGIPSDGSATDEQLDKALDLYRSGK